MSLPPQILRIKRKRVDEPVDSLYIESEDSQTKRRVTEQNFVFRRLEENAAFHTPPPPSHSEIPQVIATRPGEEDFYRARPPVRVNLDRHPVGPINSTLPTPVLENGSDRTVLAPRRYRLSRLEAAAALRASQSQESSSVNKIAVFVEARPKQNPVPPRFNHTTTIGQVPEQQTTHQRKRPGRAAVVPKVRNMRDVDMNRSKGNDFDLHAALQKYADEEFGAPLSTPSIMAMQDATTSNPNTLDDIEMLDEADDEDYVYDTYMRYSEPQAAISMDTTAPGTGAIGFLVITDEDQDLWEVFGEDEDDSEQDWDSEQDDENAENYYGADYPEDEVASDDEFNTGAYGYRRGGSDDEEYDLNEELESDGEGGRKKFPWQGKTWRKGDVDGATGSEEDEEDDG